MCFWTHGQDQQSYCTIIFLSITLILFLFWFFLLIFLSLISCHNSNHQWGGWELKQLLQSGLSKSSIGATLPVSLPHLEHFISFPPFQIEIWGCRAQQPLGVSSHKICQARTTPKSKLDRTALRPPPLGLAPITPGLPPTRSTLPVGRP